MDARGTVTRADLPADGQIGGGPTPKHAQLREILRRMAERELPPGSAIPSERELAQHYAVSRLTVRTAIGRLVDEGLLRRVRGKGTFIAPRRIDLQLSLMSFTADMRRRGRTPSTEVLGTAVQTPPGPTRGALALGAGARAYRLRRLRLADDVPLAVEDGWYHPGVVPGLLELDLTRSVYAQLAEHYDLRFDTAWQTVRAESADAGLARRLGLRTGASLLVFRRVSSVHGQPVEDMTSWYRGDHYQVTVQLDRSSPGSGPRSTTAEPDRAQGGHA